MICVCKKIEEDVSREGLFSYSCSLNPYVHFTYIGELFIKIGEENDSWYGPLVVTAGAYMCHISPAWNKLTITDFYIMTL